MHSNPRLQLCRGAAERPLLRSIERVLVRFIDDAIDLVDKNARADGEIQRLTAEIMEVKAELVKVKAEHAKDKSEIVKLRDGSNVREYVFRNMDDQERMRQFDALHEIYNAYLVYMNRFSRTEN